MAKKKRLMDEYQFPGFRPKATIKGIFGDSRARVIHLVRRQKKQFVAVVGQFTETSTTKSYVVSEIFPVGKCEYTWNWKFAVYFAVSAGR